MDSAVAYGKADHSKCNLCKEYFSNIFHQFLSLAQPGHCEVAGSEESHEIQTLWQPKGGFNSETRNYLQLNSNYLQLLTNYILFYIQKGVGDRKTGNKSRFKDIFQIEAAHKRICAHWQCVTYIRLRCLSPTQRE